MNRYGLSFHHFGLAVREEAPARLFLEGLGYRVDPLITDPEQNVQVSLARAPGLPTIELVLPTEVPGPLTSVLKGRDSNIYHSCYVTDDAEASLAAIAADELPHTEVSASKPAVLFGGAPVSFHYVSGFGLIELIHRNGSLTIANV
ncbi:MAG TPA: VOC family protein [Solimonas sp.]